MSSQRSERTVTDSLLDAIIGLAAHLELGQVLQSFVDASVELTGARYGAINILDTSGTSTTFLQTGVSEQIASKMASAPHNTGVLARIPPHGVLRLADLTKHSAFIGFPDEHPVMGPFLGTAVRVREQIFGYLYLADKDGGFDDDDDRIVRSLAAGVGVAIQNAQLYAEANRRQHWLEAGQEITTMLLSGIDQDEALEHIAATARTVANADTCALVLPGIDGELIMEIVDGYLADALLGLHLPRGGRSHTVMLDGIGMVVDSLSTARNLQVDALRHFGPAMYAPLEHEGAGVGVLVLLRRNGGQTFSATDLATAESFAAQAALALVLDEARAAADRATLLDERERIARDLHDLAIQQLFATGMQLDQVRLRAATGIAETELTEVVSRTIDSLDSTVREIRGIVHALRDPASATSMAERLLREASLARTGLGFAPSLIVQVDGNTINVANDADAARLDALVADEIADDVVAVVREGLANAARHAKAQSVRVRIQVVGEAPNGEIRIEVVDDGVGIPDSLSRRSGTNNLAARARQYYGRFSISPAEDGGTHLRWAVPLN
jgi:signal transduction histidine kinase